MLAGDPALPMREDDVLVVPPPKCSCTVLGTGGDGAPATVRPAQAPSPNEAVEHVVEVVDAKGFGLQGPFELPTACTHGKATKEPMGHYEKLYRRGLGPKYLLYSTQAVSWIVIDIPGPNQPDLSRK